MTQKEKQLLLVDLCARLSYGVKVKFYSMEYPYGSEPVILTVFLLKDRWENIQDAKPYLRPMSFMTEEEKEEYCNLQDKFIYSSQYPVTDACELFDWLNSHYLDYRGLISTGLALEAPEEMYKNE